MKATCLWLPIVLLAGTILVVTASAAGSPGPTDKPLTPWEVKNGIGPITEEMHLGPIDPQLADQGETEYNEKCRLCHKLDQRHVGPALGDVTRRRSPEFIMNLLLNTHVMEARHPVIRQMTSEYKIPMPQPRIDRKQARAILEYLRKVGKE